VNITHTWDNRAARGDWQIAGGRLATGDLLRSAVIISLFTDRVAQPGYPGADRRGWWADTLDGRPIGSRLWQLRRRKIADRNALINEATDILNEALQWLVDDGIATRVTADVTLPPAGIGQAGTLLSFVVTLFQPSAPATVVRTLWSTV
jgi:phage gp46-like protein